jgi:hypothetical protein
LPNKEKTRGVQPRARTGEEVTLRGTQSGPFLFLFFPFLLLFLLSFFLLIPFQNNTSRKGRRPHKGNQQAAHGTVIKVLREAGGWNYVNGRR